MASSKPIAAILILLNLAIFTFVTTNAATCPNLGMCLSIANDLVKVQAGSQANTACCQLIGSLASADASLCLCNSLKTTILGSVLAQVLGLTTNLPVVGGLVPTVGGVVGQLPLVGGLLPSLGGGSQQGQQIPIIGGLLPTVGGIVGQLPLIGGLLPSLGGGQLPLIGSLPLNVLTQQITVLVNACGLDATQFTCS